MNKDKAGRIVWHDLFTTDMQASKSFYERIAGWSYVTEHATDFAWGGGEKDFVLALVRDEAGAGFVEQPRGRVGGWVPYVEVKDVDAAAVLAVEFDGTVEKDPFEVPGVGRNCVLRDPNGALIGICFSRHSFPAPTLQFDVECYLTQSGDFPAAFYQRLFGWDARPANCVQGVTHILTLSGEKIAVCAVDDSCSDGAARWAPGIRVTSLSDALDAVRALKGTCIDPPSQPPDENSFALVCDPNGARAYFIA